MGTGGGRGGLGNLDGFLWFLVWLGTTYAIFIFVYQVGSKAFKRFLMLILLGEEKKKVVLQVGKPVVYKLS